MSDNKDTVQPSAHEVNPTGELMHQIEIDRTLRGLVSDTTMMDNLKKAANAQTYMGGAELARGKMNTGEKGGWSEIALLLPDGHVQVGVRTSRGWIDDETSKYALADVNATRKAVIEEKLKHFEQIMKDPNYRRLSSIRDWLWEDPTSEVRQYYDNKDNWPSLDKFKAVPGEFLDEQGRAWINPDTGFSLVENSLYRELFSNTNSQDIKPKVQAEINKVLQLYNI